MMPVMSIDRFPVEAGHILMFARAIGDPNPQYTDPDGAVAPPTFVQASAQFDESYGLRLRPGRPWMGSSSVPSQMAEAMRKQQEMEAADTSATPAEAAAGRTGGGAAGGGGTGLHAEQHYEYHRVPRVGDVLSATVRDGETWQKEGRRGGALQFRETITEFRDEHGDLVVTARAVSVRTSRVVEKSE